LGLAALTAYQLINNEPHRLEAGETVLIQGASGGVGTFAVQFAKQNGATVIGTTSRNEELLASLGVDEVVNYKEQEVQWNFKNKLIYLLIPQGKALKLFPL
ncbi:zinc-binding dehydrogenase, partial [Salmonella enterica]|uniref:zinc-binding dehydrogenase n=1 Tax=Salmonella enterica TaxID=28901 RepID=UPI000CCA8774